MIRSLWHPSGDWTRAELESAVRSHRSPSRGPRLIDARIDRDTVAAILAALADRAPLILTNPKRPTATAPRSLPDHAAVSLQTSGSSAAPRWITHSRAALLSHAGASVRALGCTHRDVWMIALPLAHVSGLAPIVRALVAGSGVALLPRFSPTAFSDALDETGATVTSLVPTMLADLVRMSWHPPPHLRTVLVGGAPCPADLAARARDLGIPIVTTYGMTETFSHVALDGLLLDGVEARLDDVGRLELRTPAACTWPRWLTTSDRVRLEGRRIDVLGRADDVIVTGGENVSPSAVEDALVAEDAVKSACVVGLPDPRWGELVAAALIPRDHDRGVDTPSLDRALRTVLATYERPRRYVVLRELPTTVKGSPDRARIKAALMSSGSPPTD